MKHIAYVTDTELIEAVKNGLSKSPKSLPSWLLYDATGDELFQLIMRLPEYYPTRCEYEILSKHKEDFARYFIDKGQSFHLIELGAGDGTKTELLLDALQHAAAKFRYSPVDISDSVLEQLNKKLRVRYPELPIQPLHGSYEDAFRLLEPATRKVVLFLGANIGNMTLTQVNKFLTQTSTRLSRNDMMVIGFDLKKDPRIIQAAYDDKSGVTRQFNLNLLHRLNRSLGAQFILSEFEHYPTYNPETGTAA
ncbi:MAG TPA: L-histidine N(alpha)-methyltransferase, partial [Sphingobacteriaceae bacterium]